MGGIRKMPRSKDPGIEAFPWFVSLGSLLVGLLLFFDATVPALRERDVLEEARRELGADAMNLQAEKSDIRARRRSLPFDPETVLVEMDRQGFLSEDMVRIFGPDEDEPRRRGDRGR